MLKNKFKQLMLGIIIAGFLVLLRIDMVLGIIILSTIIVSRQVYNVVYSQDHAIDWLNIVVAELGGILVYILINFL
ncbi:MAG: hypothetical protein ACQEP9_02955 [Bacillota bacterium]